MIAAHSPFGASSAHRWMACPGSVQLSEKAAAQAESTYAAEGTMLHEVAAEVLHAWWANDSQNPRVVELLDGLTPEQRTVVAAYTAEVRMAVQEAETWAGNNVALMLERRVSMPDLHPDFYGTADAIVTAYRDDEVRVWVLDLKCGAGVSVEVDYGGRVNPQLAYYALGAIAAAGFKVDADDGIGDHVDGQALAGCDIIVVQPRAGGVKRRSVAVIELEDTAWDLVAAARTAMRNDPPFKAGAHCRFCPAKSICPALREMSITKAREEFAVDFETGHAPTPDTPEAIARAMEIAEVMEEWISGVRARAAQMAIVEGKTLPGWKVVKGRAGNRRWSGEDNDVFEALTDAGLPPDAISVTSIISPAACERIAKELGVDVDLSTLVTRADAKPVLARATDSRQPVSVGAKADFEHLTVKDL
jgi:CRISPR/Cas system-associated exonuclease Cas4 (RecB family)